MAWEQEYKRLHGVDWQQAYESWLRDRGVPFAEIGIYKRIAQRIVADVGEVEITAELVASRHEAARAAGQTQAQLDSFKEFADVFVAFHEERREKDDVGSSGTRPAPAAPAAPRKLESMRAPAPAPTAPEAIDLGPVSAPEAEPKPDPERKPVSAPDPTPPLAASKPSPPDGIDLGPLEEASEAAPDAIDLGPLEEASEAAPDAIDLGPLQDPPAAEPATAESPPAPAAPADEPVPASTAPNTIDLDDGPAAAAAPAPVPAVGPSTSAAPRTSAPLPKSKRVCRSCGSPTNLDFRRKLLLQAGAGAGVLGLIAAVVLGWAGGIGTYLFALSAAGLVAILLACQRCDSCGKPVEAGFLVAAELLEIRDIRRRLGAFTVAGIVVGVGMFIVQAQLASAVDPETRTARVHQIVQGTVTHLGADPRYELVAEELGAEGVITDYHTLLLTGDAPEIPAGVSVCEEAPVPYCMRVVLGRYGESVVVEGFGENLEHPIAREELPVARPEEAAGQ